ncbi:type II toxin-antitoxin system RelB/DinJ family antitoxin [Lactiplantibacillus plantarum]|uniref:Polysaccharide biosynthesis protein n=2 Tax=Lactiplantibacillus plantarum TaxID=1590 RepID=F9UN05_LACPL|nr:type II toxin-antitoxin system RelB/DinJ family antitoxin [Lactiplantibacillus plantarum]ATI70917.1 polysaccharide biosynthesis protein [Lactiplantibacillus plantarum]KGH43503.1 polysaccharide biosynthesis protein [Lactiplantibacillus plantarum CMPG5300]MCZ2137882.1 type II toxin-antitoxin system RelB/DinJ family antitoxin [Lactiplantibacillus plantarum]MCZ2274241.1 type II toxin-antitoxin system RelB/DinJ family antitoxin [Lactiplantibacillus plantarum]MDE4415849.1 polysaccharide biosynthe
MSTDTNDKTMFAMRISKQEKSQLKRLYADLGLDLSTAVNLFFRQSLVENGLPFQPMRASSRENKDN